ncbi:MAG: HAD family hydrolase [Phycisphaerales bacterium]|nr:HAD family hydrolase [Phycisphaerales bacterium]
MSTCCTSFVLRGLLPLLFAFGSAVASAADPLPSWNDTAPKQAILRFVERVTRDGSPDFVPPAERIAAFDNDGTLWCEQPAYFQLLFALDRVKAMAAAHPQWKETEPFKSVLAGDMQGLIAGGEKALLEIIAATHAGMTTDEFARIAREWVTTSRHPKFQRPYIECVYQPQIELLKYLREKGFKTYIVSGGGIEFMRPWTEQVYGIPPEQVVGSSARLRYEVRDGIPVILKLPQIDHIDDKAGKPVGIHKFIGRRPILACGNSDGDFEMLEYVTSGPGPRLGLIIHHDDEQREFAYDRASHIGQLNRGLDEAARRNWIIVSMKNDWPEIFLD